MAMRETRLSVLREVQELAPHEVGCRCMMRGTFEWESHAENCPRHQIGSMIEGMMSKDGPLGDGPSYAHDVKPLEEELRLAERHPEFGIDRAAVEEALEEAKADAQQRQQDAEAQVNQEATEAGLQ